MLEAEPVTWRVLVNVVAAGLGERFRASGAAQLRVLWAWALFVVGGIGFQKTSEHWQAAVPAADRGVPAAAFDVVVAAAALGSLAVLAAVALALPAFLRDLRSGGWTHVRRPILAAALTTVIAVAALIAVALRHEIIAASVFVAFAVVSLFAWTHAAAEAARRLRPIRAHAYLALVVSATMPIMTAGAALWFASVAAHAPSFVGTAQLALVATFMLTGNLIAASAVRSLRA